MNRRLVGGAKTASRTERVIGRYRGDRPGPVLVCVAAIHGNEPAGVLASQTVLSRLLERRPPFLGEVAFLVGNTRAFAAGSRFIEKDLNRVWTPERVRALPRATSRSRPVPEDLEQKELLEEIDAILDRAEGPARLLDLHTSSAEGRPFLTVGDTLRNRRLARRFPLPAILGLEENIDGSLLEYLNNRGLETLGVEAGQHRDDASVAHIEAALWIAMVAGGQLAPGDAPGLEKHEAALREASRSLPDFVEIVHRYPITPRSRFAMKPGYSNFDTVSEGEFLATDRRGRVLADRSGRILLPLYQGQGSDGFFLARDVGPLRLRFSALLRRLRLGALVPLLPGIRRHPSRDRVLLVDTRVARWRSLEIARLLGYRKLRRQGALILVSRRRHDLRSPGRYT